MDDVIVVDGLRYRFSGNYYQRGQVKTGERFLHRAIWVRANGSIPDGNVIHHRDENTRNNALGNLECMLASDHHKLHFGEMWEQLRKDPASLAFATSKASKWHRSNEGRKFFSDLNARNRADGKFDGLDMAAFFAGRDRWLKSDECKDFNRAHMSKLRANGVLGDPSDECRQKAAEWHRSDDGRNWHSVMAKDAWAKRATVSASCAICGQAYQTFTPTRSKFCSGRCKASALRERRKQGS